MGSKFQAVVEVDGHFVKRCSKCRLLLPVDKFSNDKTKASGFRSDCKKCNKRYRLGKKLYDKAHEPKMTLLSKLLSWFK